MESTIPLDADSGLEQLGLPVRARNALHGAGCKTIGDVLRLDLAAPIRGLGRKAKEELFDRLSDAGFPHPADEHRASELGMLEQRIKRIEERVDDAMAAIAKELRAARVRISRMKLPEPRG